MYSLRYKIGSGYFILVLIGLATSTFAIFSLTRLRENVAPIIQETYKSAQIAENLILALDDQESAQLAAVVDEPDLYQIYFNDGRDDFLQWLERTKEFTPSYIHKTLVDSIILTYRTYLRSSNILFDLLIHKKKISIGQRYQKYITQPIGDKLRNYCSKYLEANQVAMIKAEKTIRETTLNSVISMILAAVASIILSVTTSIRFTRTILKPAERLTKTVRKISQGHLNQKIDVVTDDEIGELSREFNKMTERLRMYEEMNIHQLISEKKKSETIVASIAEPVIVTDNTGLVILMNQAAATVFEISENNLQGKPLHDVVGKTDFIEILENGSVLSSEQEHRDLLFPFKRNDVMYYYRPHQTHILDEQGNIQFVVTLLHDVTRFKNLERMKSEFIATVSHELRTPITSLAMGIDILSKNVVGHINKQQQELLTSAKDDVERLRKLVKDLLDLSRLESGKYEIKKEFVHFKRIAEDAVHALQLPFKEKNIDLTIAIEETLPVIFVDQHKLTWVLNNLLSNALRFTDSGGKVTIAAHCTGNKLSVSVSDTGHGIANEYREAIFDKFVQLKSATETTPGSVGLGLAIAREVIEEHNGKIWVESQVGVGSTFTFTIPLNL